MSTNKIYRMKTDGFHGELFCPAQDGYPGKALICFSGSDGKFELSRMLAQVFQTHGLTALALAYVMEEGLPQQFCRVPIDPLEAAAARLHDMGYEKALPLCREAPGPFTGRKSPTAASGWTNFHWGRYWERASRHGS